MNRQHERRRERERERERREEFGDREPSPVLYSRMHFIVYFCVEYVHVHNPYKVVVHVQQPITQKCFIHI